MEIGRAAKTKPVSDPCQANSRAEGGGQKLLMASLRLHNARPALIRDGRDGLTPVNRSSAGVVTGQNCLPEIISSSPSVASGGGVVTKYDARDHSARLERTEASDGIIPSRHLFGGSPKV